ncbi:hypothetical protein ACFVT8_16440 [Lysinibacillus sp. NPDC058147]|uniref:hypothetical protein n=1 Tax=unclassified Lysinibacillus TaxID=2636778 RepID=UPI0036D8E669
MKKYLYSFLTLFTILFLFAFSAEKASAKDIDITYEDLETLAQQYNLTDVTFINEQQENDATLNFSSIEEFEEFLKNEEKQELVIEQSSPILFRASQAGTKTYSTWEFTGVSTITSYAKVTRNSSGIVTKVVVWSSQTGFAFPIAYTENSTDYVLNKSKTGGTAYVYGTKAYGATIGGQGIAYKRDVTYEIPF